MTNYINNKLVLFAIFVVNIFYTQAFINIGNFGNNIIKPLNQYTNHNERKIYKSYLIGLRRTRRYIQNTTNIESLKHILEHTNFLIHNYTNTQNNTKDTNDYTIDNTNTIAKNIVMGNIVLDVSNVKNIHISTNKETIKIELDKTPPKQNDNIDFVKFLEKINNVETMLNTLSLLNHFMDIK